MKKPSGAYVRGPAVLLMLKGCRRLEAEIKAKMPNLLKDIKALMKQPKKSITDNTPPDEVELVAFDNVPPPTPSTLMENPDMDDEKLPWQEWDEIDLESLDDEFETYEGFEATSSAISANEFGEIVPTEDPSEQNTSWWPW